MTPEDQIAAMPQDPPEIQARRGRPRPGQTAVDDGRPESPAPSGGHAVSIAGLNAYYGDTHAIRGVSLEYAPNEVTAMIGPSGCGKSTLVRCINRMHEEIQGARAEGRVLLDDLDIYGDAVDVVAVGGRSGWCSRNRTRSRRCRSSTTSPPACG